MLTVDKVGCAYRRDISGCEYVQMGENTFETRVYCYCNIVLRRMSIGGTKFTEGAFWSNRHTYGSGQLYWE